MCESGDNVPVENSCEVCSMVLVEPVYRCDSGHEICGPCYSDVMDRERERRDEGGDGPDERSEEDDEFDCPGNYMRIQRNEHGEHHTEPLRPHTVGGNQWRKNRQTTKTETSYSEREDSDDEPLTILRPPEYKRSFIDIIAGMSASNISYDSEKNDIEAKEEGSDVEAILEVFKKNSISSLDSNKSGGSLKFKPIVCPLDSCFKFVSVSGLITHFKFDHRNIPIETIPCHASVSYFIPSSSIETDGIINQRILVVEGEFSDDASYFTLNISKHCFTETAMILIWISEIKTNMIQFLYKIQAKNNSNERGKVVSYFGPVVTNHREPLAVYQNGDCLVIPMTVLDSFKKFADGFDLEIHFSVDNEGVDL